VFLAVLTILPLSESADDINMVLSGVFNHITGRKPHRPEDSNFKHGGGAHKGSDGGKDEVIDVDEEH
jgi:hypothetical protein